MVKKSWLFSLYGVVVDTDASKDNNNNNNNNAAESMYNQTQNEDSTQVDNWKIAIKVISPSRVLYRMAK